MSSAAMQFGLFGRLSTADVFGARRSLALQHAGSWAHGVSQGPLWSMVLGGARKVV